MTMCVEFFPSCSSSWFSFHVGVCTAVLSWDGQGQIDLCVFLNPGIAVEPERYQLVGFVRLTRGN